MKYCAKCGTQMSDDTVLCPQCNPESNKQQPQNLNQEIPRNNISRKTTHLVVSNIIISIITLIATIGTYFISPTSNNSANNNDNPNSNSDVFNSTCPANEYGNHNWAPARCTEPAQCYNCDAYRDDKLGEHSFYTDDDGFCDCTYCGILYDVYINSLD